MEIYYKEADRWLRQAEYDLKAADWNREGGFFAPACFWAQQSAAKALRSFLFINSEDARESRSVSDLLDRALTYEEEFKSIVNSSSTNLDIYYKTSRFPDALPGGIPAEVITEREAKEAITKASEILSIVEKKRKGFLPETM
ncbi:MAG: HEPN domain-containing protein [Thermodesulfobacteriota bacterium]